MTLDEAATAVERLRGAGRRLTHEALRLGIDIGGTFTDGALVDETTGDIVIVKVPTTPVDPAIGFMAAVERALQRSQSPSEAVRLMVHATTVATNALIEGKTARVG